LAEFITTPKHLDNEDIVRKNKKFVFQIYPENIKFIESFSYQEKHDFINQLISEYRESKIFALEQEKLHSKAKNLLIIILAVIIGIPLLLYIINVSLDLTKASYYDMQTKFEKLF
jgi:phospholipid N-methyltransferase